MQDYIKGSDGPFITVHYNVKERPLCKAIIRALRGLH
jgi:hypothetical protein